MKKDNNEQRIQQHWKATLKLLTTVLLVWFAVSYLAGIILAPWLNKLHLGGYPLGFWFAQQGSIYGFVILVFLYARRMNRIDHRYHLDSDDEEGAAE